MTEVDPNDLTDLSELVGPELATLVSPNSDSSESSMSHDIRKLVKKKSEIFFCPLDKIGLLRSNLGFFLFRKFGVVGFIFIDLPGVKKKNWLTHKKQF